MHFTRRYWTAVALAGTLAGAAVVFARPLLLVGAAGLGAWLLVRQALFVRAVVRTEAALTVDQSVARERVVADDEASVALDAALPEETPCRVTVTANPPVGATAASAPDRRLLIGADEEGGTDDENGDGGEYGAEDRATTAFSVGWPLAGRFRFGPPTVAVADELGLFESTFPASAPTPTVTVVPRRPDDVHVGEGGEAVATAFGDHKTGDFGLGLDPGEVREYVPGDALRRVDWKATARSTSPHVREFEEETDRRTVVVFDHRASMGVGPEGERKLDYARQVALAFAEYAGGEREPLGLYAVGDGGVTARQPPAADPGTYSTVRAVLHDAAPTESVGSEGHRTDRREEKSRATSPPRAAAGKADRLRDEDSPFAARLRPFLASPETYVQRVADDPLYGTVRTEVAATDGTVSAVLVTDDRNRAEVREAVELARRRCGEVLAFLAPTVLFEREGLADVEAAYDRYADFEAFRRDLARLDGVAAFEIAPGDRLDALLAAGPPTRATFE